MIWSACALGMNFVDRWALDSLKELPSIRKAVAVVEAIGATLRTPGKRLVPRSLARVRREVYAGIFSIDGAGPRPYDNRFSSSTPSHFETTIVATAFPIRFVIEIASPMNR
jgi:hypothetical protein